VGGGGIVEGGVVVVCVSVYKGGRWRYSGGMCGAGVCVCIKVAGVQWRHVSCWCVCV